MAITVYSPHSGKPVKVRDEDIGRALRDEEGRIFYVITRDDGKGLYASFTRKGSDKDQQRYDKLIKQHTESLAQTIGDAMTTTGSKPDQPVAHDATGRKRRKRSLTRTAAGAFIALVIIAVAYVAVVGKQNLPLSTDQQQWLSDTLPWLDQYQPPVERWPVLKQYLPWLPQNNVEDDHDDNTTTSGEANHDPTPSP